MKSRILLVGNDEELKLTRAAILNQRWSAFLASPKDAMRSIHLEEPDLLILCHSLFPDQAEGLVHVCRDRFPEARILALEACSTSVRRLKVDAIVETVLGPPALVSAIEALLRDGEQSRPK